MASNLNPANAITASRFLTLPVYIWSLEQGDPQVAIVALIACAVLDLFDGAVARALNCTTAFGEVFDAIADGLLYGAMMLLLPFYGLVPWLPVAIIVGLGVVTLIERSLYARRAGRAVNYRSFAMEKMVAYTAYLIGCGVGQFEVEFAFWSCIGLMAIVIVHDTKRLLIDPVAPAAAEAPTPMAPPGAVRGGAS